MVIWKDSSESDVSKELFLFIYFKAKAWRTMPGDMTFLRICLEYDIRL